MSPSSGPCSCSCTAAARRSIPTATYADLPAPYREASITVPTLVVAADRDVVRTEHAVLLTIFNGGGYQVWSSGGW
jgi:pimeloyl-ACP methyl ester carboxylesterase